MSIMELNGHPVDYDQEQHHEGGRVPPQNRYAEQCVLGGMLLSTRAIDECADIVIGPNFYDPRHELIFHAVTSIHWEGLPVDVITTGDWLERKGDLRRVGGQSYLHELVSAVPTAANAPYYANIVVEQAVLRGLVEAGTRIVQLGYAQEPGDVDDILGAAVREVDSVGRGKVAELTAAASLIDDVIERTSDENTRLSTPWPSFTRILDGGFEGGKVYSIGADTSMGKTIMLFNIARHFLLHHRKAFAATSMEMSADELLLRLVADIGNVALSKIKNPDSLSALERRAVADAQATIKRMPPLWIDDRTDVTVEMMRSYMRQAANRSDLGGVGIDYLQLFATSTGRKFGTRQEAVAHQSRQVKMTAKMLDRPVFLLAQLSRRDGGRPVSSDFKESSAIEQDADVVAMLHRDRDAATGYLSSVAGVSVEKNRGGATDGFVLHVDGPRMRMTESDPDDVTW